MSQPKPFTWADWEDFLRRHPMPDQQQAKLTREQVEAMARSDFPHPKYGLVPLLAQEWLDQRLVLEQIYHESSRADIENLIVEFLGYEPEDELS